MSIQEYLAKMKNIQEKLLEFLDSDASMDDSFNEFTIFLKNQNIQDQNYLIEFLHIISKISANHFRKQNLISKIEKILTFLKADIMQQLTSTRIFDIFRESKRILLFLFEDQFITINEYIYSKLRASRNLVSYFEPELVSYLTNQPKKVDQSFEESRREGENPDYLSKLIRTDSVIDFITYITKSNLSLVKTTIEPSFFDTNPFLMYRKLSLIEYSAFFGSIQIFRYLQQNDVKLKADLWRYAAHSNNPELIHILEEKHIIAGKYDSDYCFKDSINCYHNEIANYIKDNLPLELGDDQNYLLEYHNYDFLPNNISDKSLFRDLCIYDYLMLASSMINDLSENELNQILFNFF